MGTARRHYFLVADKVGHETWTNNQLAALVRLMSHMHERWARDGLRVEEASTCVLGPGDVIRITGLQRPADARASLESLAELVSMTVEVVAAKLQRSGSEVAAVSYATRLRDRAKSTRSSRGFLRLRWPKFAEFQCLPSRHPPVADPRPAPPVPVPVPVPERKKNTGVKSAGDKPPKVTWITPYAEVWTKHYGGDFAFGQAAKALSQPLVKGLGPAESLRRWENYCAGTAAAVASVTRFAQTVGAWDARKPPAPARRVSTEEHGANLLLRLEAAGQG